MLLLIAAQIADVIPDLQVTSIIVDVDACEKNTAVVCCYCGAVSDTVRKHKKHLEVCVHTAATTHNSSAYYHKQLLCRMHDASAPVSSALV
jgi:hypothetical protein